MNDAYGLLKIQEANLKMLKEIDRISLKYRIPYMLDAGTLLGAVRHGGFIPWDDDVDIAMTRNAWEAFKKVAPRELKEGMTLLLPDSLDGGRKFFDFTPRIIYEYSRRRKPDEGTAYYNEKLNKLWVDIFILDRLPDNDAAAWAMKTRQKELYLLAMGHRKGLDMKKYSVPLRLPVFLGAGAGKAVSMKGLFLSQDRSAKAWNRKKTARWFYSNYQPDFLYVTLTDECVKELTRMPFEDTELSVTQHYDDILKALYGDYMKLPPKEKRVPAHGSREMEIYG
jgi:lipopolysaccharide cholinephosphotransferase